MHEIVAPDLCRRGKLREAVAGGPVEEAGKGDLSGTGDLKKARQLVAAQGENAGTRIRWGVRRALRARRATLKSANPSALKRASR